LCDSCYENGDDYLGDSRDLEAAARWAGDPGALTVALAGAGGDLSAGFIEELPSHQGHYRVHDFWHHAPDYVRKRRNREAAKRPTGYGQPRMLELCPVAHNSLNSKQ